MYHTSDELSKKVAMLHFHRLLEPVCVHQNNCANLTDHQALKNWNVDSDRHCPKKKYMHPIGCALFKTQLMPLRIPATTLLLPE